MGSTLAAGVGHRGRAGLRRVDRGRRRAGRPGHRPARRPRRHPRLPPPPGPRPHPPGPDQRVGRLNPPSGSRGVRPARPVRAVASPVITRGQRPPDHRRAWFDRRLLVVVFRPVRRDAVGGAVATARVGAQLQQRPRRVCAPVVGGVVLTVAQASTRASRRGVRPRCTGGRSRPRARRGRRGRTCGRGPTSGSACPRTAPRHHALPRHPQHLADDPRRERGRQVLQEVHGEHGVGAAVGQRHGGRVAGDRVQRQPERRSDGRAGSATVPGERSTAVTG